MASDATPSRDEYEFTADQNQLIGSLARKMGLVGLVLMFFGILQLINGVMSVIATRNPDKVLSAAKQAGLPDAQVQQLEKALATTGWISPATASAIGFALTGLFMVLVGTWTQQAAGGFAGIVVTRGQDIRRLMDALGALHKKYSLMYTLLWIAAIVSLVSLAVSLYQHWSGK